MNTLAVYILFAGLWSIINGLLHDIFILRERRPFDRELIRLLIDGHILIFAGIFYLISFYGILNQEMFAYFISIAASVFLLGYCSLIFKMLPSVFTMLINAIALVWLLVTVTSR